jgi:PAS domain S-box-containing protein
MSDSLKKTILLVEDEKVTAKTVTKILEKHGYSVLLAFSGEQAVTVAADAQNIDLLLTDIDLGDGMDGTRAAEQILKNRNIPALFLSSHTEPEVVEKTEAITSYGYVVKNAGETVLIASIKMAFKLFKAHEIINLQKLELEKSSEIMHTSLKKIEASNEILITTQKQLIEKEKLMAEANNMLHLVIDTIPARIFWKGPDFRYIGCNRLVSADAGLSDPSELIGLDDFDMPWREQAVHFRADDNDIISTGNAKINYEEKLTQKDGKVLWLNTTKVPLKNIDGEIIGILGTWEDVTDKKNAMESLRLSEEKFRNIFETMSIGYFRTSLSGDILDLNPACLKIFGYNSLEEVKEVLRNNSKNVYADHEEWIRIRKILTDETAPSTYTVKLLKRDGSEFFADVSLRYVRSYEGIPDHLEGLVEDITERIKTQDLLIQSEKMITVAGLAAGMAHEINNPLGIIMQNSENAKNRIFGDIPGNINAAAEAGTNVNVIRKYATLRRINNYLDEIHEAGSRAAGILENMLQFSRGTESRFNYLNINNIIDKAIDLAMNDYSLKKKYDFRQIKITKNYAELPDIQCQEIQIEQVLLNILKNAAQAMSSKNYKDNETPHLIITTSFSDNSIKLEINDNGPGMTESVRKKIFEPFFTTKEPGSGTGLGLSVSFYIITDGHGGRIYAESAPDKGSSFIIILPADRNL